PEAVRASGLLRVYLQGNIHGGEVPGKEALLMLVREITQGEHAAWLDRMVLLVVPVYNADGNEAIALTNRPRQHGPIGGMGQRPNAQGYDLTRDHMKLDAPETRSLVRMLTAYDPQVAVDLHTTNGSRHAYHLTYSPPLHPGTEPGLVALLRERWLPAVTESVRRDHGWEMYYYGNTSGRGESTGWYTFDHRPRFNNNYLGLRNRLAILGEAYAYATFEDRVLASERFVEALLDFAAANAGAVRSAVDAADAVRVAGRVLPTRAEPERSAAQVEILMGAVEEERHPYTGAIIYRRLDVSRPTTMWEYGTFQATDSARAPAEYYVPQELSVAVERLQAHGVRMERLPEERTFAVEEFVLDSSTVAPREFQGHNERTVFGAYRLVTRTLPAGTVVVDLAQPLGRLAFYLLEPRSDDGLVAWGLLDDALEDGTYPVLRRPATGEERRPSPGTPGR
ncbi:MAG TPA: M14 family metallopeptidase, partial [Candidatus Thermoplasmatota archaeon]